MSRTFIFITFKDVGSNPLKRCGFFLLPVDIPEYSLTEEFCRKHFLTGLLLRELGLALQDEQDLRHLALACLKNLMAKHSLDSRYAVKVTFAHENKSKHIQHK